MPATRLGLTLAAPLLGLLLCAAAAVPAPPTTGLARPVSIGPLVDDLAPGDSTEYTRFEAWQPGQGPAAVLNLPPAWQPKGPAAILIADGAWPTGLRDRLVAALLGQGLTVLELAAGAEPSLPMLYGALAMLRQERHAGWIVAIGQDAAGAVALRAMRESSAVAQLGAEGPRLAAAVALGGEAPRFARSERETAQAGGPLHLRRLCVALRDAAGPVTESHCRAALAGPQSGLGLGLE